MSRRLLQQTDICTVTSYANQELRILNHTEWKVEPKLILSQSGVECVPSTCLVRISVVVMGHDELGGQLSGARARGHGSGTQVIGAEPNGCLANDTGHVALSLPLEATQLTC